MRPRGAVPLLALLLAASCKPPAQPAPSGAARPRPRVTVTAAESRPMESVVEAPGTLDAAEEISVPARVAGVLDSVSFKEGDRVGPSTVLAEVELERHRLREEAAKADLERARAAASLAETVYANRVALQEEGKKLKNDRRTPEQMATWKADLERTRAEHERARIELALARRAHEDARVRPPMEGVVNRKLVSRGEYVKPETVLATMLNVSTLHLRFTVSELEAARLRPGQEASFTLRSAPGRTFTARIFHLSQKADAATRSVEVKAEVPGGDEAFRAGLYAQARVVTERRTGVVVPERAVVPSERGPVVFEVGPDRKAIPHPVRLGLRLPGGVEIAEGLPAGTRVVVDGAGALRPGAEVEIGDARP